MEFIAAVMHDKFLVLVTQILLQRNRRSLLRVDGRFSQPIFADSALILDLLHPTLPKLIFAKSMIILNGSFPPFFLLRFLLHLNRPKLTIDLISSLVLILDTLIDPSIARSPLNINSIQTPHIGLI